MPIMAAMVWLLPVSDSLGECLSIDIVSKIMKLCDYDVGKNCKFIVYNLPFV